MTGPGDIASTKLRFPDFLRRGDDGGHSAIRLDECPYLSWVKVTTLVGVGSLRRDGHEHVSLKIAQRIHARASRGDSSGRA